LRKVLLLLTPQICAVSDDAADAAANAVAADVARTAASFQPSRPTFDRAIL
jgi:hypothetical protein